MKHCIFILHILFFITCGKAQPPSIDIDGIHSIVKPNAYSNYNFDKDLKTFTFTNCYGRDLKILPELPVHDTAYYYCIKGTTKLLPLVKIKTYYVIPPNYTQHYYNTWIFPYYQDFRNLSSNFEIFDGNVKILDYNVRADTSNSFALEAFNKDGKKLEKYFKEDTVIAKIISLKTGVSFNCSFMFTQWYVNSKRAPKDFLKYLKNNDSIYFQAGGAMPECVSDGCLNTFTSPVYIYSDRLTQTTESNHMTPKCIVSGETLTCQGKNYDLTVVSTDSKTVLTSNDQDSFDLSKVNQPGVYILLCLTSEGIKRIKYIKH